LPPRDGSCQHRAGRTAGDWRLAQSSRHLGFADHGDGTEVEAVERLSGGQARFGEMAFDAPPEAIGHFMLGQGGEESRSRPAFLIGLLCKFRPDQLDARQAQFAEQQFDARGVDGGVLPHAATANAQACGLAGGMSRRTAASSS
jgi:hypothetical protein